MANEILNADSVCKAIDSAVELAIAPMEKALGVFSYPCRKVGEALGSGISRGIDKIFKV